MSHELIPVNNNWLNENQENNIPGYNILRQSYYRPNLGISSIDERMFNIVNLRVLVLFKNNLNMEIPIGIFNLRNLEILNLSVNYLHGQIPEEIGNLKKLRILNLSVNRLNGLIPNKLFKLKNLQQINLGKNELNGEIPSNIDKLSKLNILDLEHNQLSGELPMQLYMLKNLEVLVLSYNNFSGTIDINKRNIPPGFTFKNINNLSKLEHLNLSFNEFNDDLFDELFQLYNLAYLNLRQNTFYGEINPLISNLKKLYFLDIGNNKLSGKLPNELFQLENLETILLNDNKIVGGINDNITKLTRLKVLDLGDNDLNRHISSHLISMIDNQHLYVNLNGNFNLDLTKREKIKFNFLFENSLEETILNFINFGKLSELKRDNELILTLQNFYEIDEDDINRIINEIIKEIEEKQKKKYPLIYKTFFSKKKVYYVNAHGEIILDQYFIVPENLSIILGTTPSYPALADWDLSNISNYINEDYLSLLLPGVTINYNRNIGGKNQLRFFKSGDIINDINLNFTMVYPNRNSVYDGGIFRYWKIKNKKYRGRQIGYNEVGINLEPKLNLHRRQQDNYINWQIDPNDPNLTLQNIVRKFEGKPGHHILILNSCLYHENYNEVKQKSILYGDLRNKLREKLNCFQDLYKETKRELYLMNKRRLQNLSSTTKTNKNCYLEMVSKLRKILTMKKNSGNSNTQKYKKKINYLKNLYNKSELFDNKQLLNILKLLPSLSMKEINHYYNKNAENKRIQRNKNRNLNPNNVNTASLFRKKRDPLNTPMNLSIFRGGQKEYIYLKKIGKRKIRYYKNGNPYVIINGKKKKI